MEHLDSSNLSKLKILAQDDNTFEIDLQTEVNETLCPALKMILNSAVTNNDTLNLFCFEAL